MEIGNVKGHKGRVTELTEMYIDFYFSYRRASIVDTLPIVVI